MTYAIALLDETKEVRYGMTAEECQKLSLGYIWVEEAYSHHQTNMRLIKKIKQTLKTDKYIYIHSIPCTGDTWYESEYS